LRANQDSGENLSHDARLSEALEDFRQKFRRCENQEHRQRNLGGRRHESIMDRVGPTIGLCRLSAFLP